MSLSAGAFPGELHLLLALVRRALGGPPPAPPAAVDWEKFAALVEHHRLAGWLQAQLPSDTARLLPAATAQRLRDLAVANTQRALANCASLLGLVRLLEESGVDALAIKGQAASHLLYGSVATRHAGDIDLLIRPADAVRADAVLQGRGWRRSRPAFVLTPRQTREYLHLKPEFEYTRPGLSTRVELRWELEGLGDFEPALALAIPWTMGGQTLRTLPPNWHLLYLFQHGARHGWFRLFWLLDVAVALGRPGFDAASTMALARRLGVETSVLLGAALAEELFGVVRPAALLPLPAERPRLARLTAAVRRILARPPNAPDTVAEWARQLRYRVALETRLRDRWAVLAPHVFSPESWAMWPLPDRWFFLYYPATPFLWLWRRFAPPPPHEPPRENLPARPARPRPFPRSASGPRVGQPHD